MVAPDEQIFDLIGMNSCSIRDHADSSVLIESCHSREVFSWDRWCIMRADECIGVGWISNNANFNSLLCNFVDCLTLSLENLSICLEQVCTFHTRSSWSSTNQHSNISILKGNERISSWDDFLDARVSSIFEFHGKSLQYLLGSWQLKKLQDNFLVWSKHASLTDEIAKESTNLSSSSSYCNSYWCSL